jgi:hypothetical protein
MMVTNSITIKNSNVYGDKDVINMVEQNIDYRRRTAEIGTIAIPPDMAYRNQGNFYGLLTELGVQADYHAFTAYLNNIRSPHDFNGKIYSLLLFSESMADDVGRLVS